MLLYNNGNTLIYLYLDLQSEYYQLSLHFFFDPGLATDMKDPNDEIMYNPLVTRNRKDLELLYNDKIV